MSLKDTQSGGSFPLNAWYAVARSDEVGREPLARRALDRRVVLYRALDGRAVVLDDRCVHRPYPLSLGHVVENDIVAGYTGFRYGPDGVVVSVPTQPQPPAGAAVRSYPAQDIGGLVWVWFGAPERAHTRPLQDLPWLEPDSGWATFGGDWVTRAGAGLLQDNFSDITHVAIVDPVLSPPALHDPPTLNVEVTEQQVRFWRDFDTSPLQTWQYEVLELPRDATYEQHEDGLFASPGLWIDRWDVRSPEGEEYSLVFTHAITPVDGRNTRHHWKVSRNFSPSAVAVTGTLIPLMTRYYERVRAALELMQRIVDEEGPRREVNLRVDAAMIQVRRVMRRLSAEEQELRS